MTTPLKVSLSIPSDLLKLTLCNMTDNESLDKIYWLSLRYRQRNIPSQLLCKKVNNADVTPVLGHFYIIACEWDVPLNRQ